jgi:PTS system beta-glucosides-specific IIC component
MISCWLGVTEPAIYGVTLPHGKQFAYTCVVAAIMGGIASVFGLTMYSMAGLGVFGIPGMINPENPTGSLVTAVVIIVASVIAGFVVAFLTYKDARSNEPKIDEKKTELKV